MDSTELAVTAEQSANVAEPAWWSASSLLSPEAAAITAFTLAAGSTFGTGTLGWFVGQGLVGVAMAPDDVRWQSVAWAAVLFVLSSAAILLGRHVVLDEVGEATWTGHLSRAAIVLGALGAVFALVAVVGGVVHGTPVPPLPPAGGGVVIRGG